MPEKSKRRKNNKNKRKNKNNQSDLSRRDGTVQKLECEQINEPTLSQEVMNPDDSTNAANTFQNLISENTLNAQEENQDLNNNTSNVNDQVDQVSNHRDEEILNTNLTSVLASLSVRDSLSYVVEVPEQEVKNKNKLVNTIKSKSLDNDDAPKIVEIIDDNSSHSQESTSKPLIDYSNVVIYDTESDVQWEKIDELQNTHTPLSKEVAKEILSIPILPLDVAHCEQTKALTPEDEISLRKYLRTLQLSNSPERTNFLEIKTEIEQSVNQEVKHRLRKKASADEFFTQRVGHSRVLDVIDEEISGESSTTSRRESYLSDKKSDIEDLEDDVFENKNTIKHKLDAKSISSLHNKPLGRLVQQQCFLVGAKLKEPEVSEARGDWTMETVERISGAEVVYLTDSSSSTSSLHEIEEDTDDSIETDVSIRMVTPTIEVTDTENLLKKTFVSNKQNHLIPGISDDTKHYLEVNEKLSDTKDLKQSAHEIVVVSTDDIKTNLYVKEVDEYCENYLKSTDTTLNSIADEKKGSENNKNFDLEIKVIKCELNDAINNLIKEVTINSESPNEDNRDLNDNINKDNFIRQDSSSSVSSSQCTAKYNPSYSSLNDVSNIQHEESSESTLLVTDNIHKTKSVTSHVKDVIDSITGTIAENKTKYTDNKNQPLSLKDFCVRKIVLFPYGEKILEELASVSSRLQNISSYGFTEQKINRESEYKSKIPYSGLPDLTSIDKILPLQTRDNIPPPINPRHSSLKKSQDDEHRTSSSTNTEPIYVCLSHSQKMLMEKTNTALSTEDEYELVNPSLDSKVCYEFSNNRKKIFNDIHEITATKPNKSHTSSRLLALIRDPSITANVNSLTKYYNRSLDQLHKDHIFSEIKPQKSSYTMNNDFLKALRPIPLPKSKKISTSFYESDESSDFTENSLRSRRNEKKFFHFSTGNLNKEIENDISSIQNLHRFHNNIHHFGNDFPRRPSLPKDLCDQQMEYIRQKEKEVDAEIQRLEEMRSNFCTAAQKKGPRAPLVTEKNFINEQIKNADNYFISRKRDLVMNIQSANREKEHLDRKKKTSLFNSQEEIQRDKMYSEYVSEMAEREDRKQRKVIKITNPSITSETISKSMSALDVINSKANNRIEKEFISKARERWEKLGITDPDIEDEREPHKKANYEPKVIEHKIKVIEDGKEKDVQRLPSHLQEFVNFTSTGKERETGSSAVWRPGAPTPPPPPTPSVVRSPGAPLPPPPPVWTPGSASASPQATRKTYHPVHFEETPPSHRKFGSSEHNGGTSGSESEGRLRTSHSAPVTGLSTLGSAALSVNSRLPRAPNPTVTLLQKAREGQIPRGTNYLQSDRDSARLPRDRPSPPKGDPVHALRKEYASESEVERSDYERGGLRKMADAQRKVEGIGPTTKDGIPVALRSEVKDPSRWYKKMYDTIHKNKYDDDYVTIRYKNRRGHAERPSSNKSQYAYFDPRSGYLSEPEGGLARLSSSTWSDAYDSDIATGPRRRTASVQEDRRSDITTSYLPSNKYSTLASARASQEIYRNQPGRIEDYVPGRSSVIDKEAKQWWDEVMDIFDGQNISSTTSLPQASPKEKKDITSAILSKSNMAKALKESGYESDSTLIFRRRDDAEAPLSPAERRAAYRDLQAGGEPPLRGFRSPAPPRQESPRRYVESDVNIHYRCPVRHDPLPLVPERELARQQADHMKRLYREQKRNKYLQELQDMQSRRHQDNFTPSQKTVVPLNRYDEADKVIAKALYTFNGQTPRELSFRKGEIIHVRRQIDANWYEGEAHGKVGLFPYNYVEIQKGETTQAPKKPAVIEGRARAKFDFIAQTNLELPLKKGEVVVLTRRIDKNWWEGRNGLKTGIFPDSYVTVLQEPSLNKPEPTPILSTDKPVASPAAHGLLNGTDKRSMGSHSYTPQPNSPALANAPPATQPLPGYVARPAQATLTPSDRGYGPPTGPGVDLNNAEPLYVDTNAEAVPYRAMYKYRPQNPDELELQEGDTVYVLEKCDDGWYVGSSQRTGRFGTFPGNYVERI